MASNSDFNQTQSNAADNQAQGGQSAGLNEGAQTASVNGAAVSGSGSQLLIDDLHEQMKVLEEQIAAGEGDIQAAEVKLAALEENLIGHLNGIEPGTGETMNDGTIAALSDDAEDEGDVTGSGETQIASEEAIAEDLADIEPAAGEGPQAGTEGSAGGYGFQSTFEAAPVGPIDDVGPIDPTQLQYGVNFNNDKVFPQDEAEGPLGNDDNPIVVAPDAHTLDETNLDLKQDGKIDVDFGNDGPGEIITTGGFTPSGSMTGGVLSSGGAPVEVSSGTNGYIGTAGGKTVFTLSIDPATGDYNYTQILPFDHADGSNPNDVITLEFGVQASDSDGDSAQTTITINVLDDAPIDVGPEVASVDETNMAPATAVAGTINADFGNDGAGSITGSGLSTIDGLTSNGAPVQVSYDAATGVYTGTAGGAAVFTLTIASNGDYNFNLTGTLDHPDNSDPNDVLTLQFGVKATDSDGDSVDGTLTINVLDDAPVAHDDFNQFKIADKSTDGNVITGEDGGAGAADNLSQDLDNTITKIAFGANTIDVPETGTTSIDGDFGTLEIAADGSYTYTLFDGAGAGTAPSPSSALNPVASDVAGQQESFTKDGITVSVANDGNYDISWLDTHDGSGLGIDNLNNSDSAKVWPKGETFKIDVAQDAATLSITIAELGDNNDDGHHGLDYVVTLADGSTVAGEVQYAPGQIHDGMFEFTLSASDFGGQLISSIDINSINDGEYDGASFLLNNVKATYPGTPADIEDEFTYMLTDGDGDSSTAVLHIDGDASGVAPIDVVEAEPIVLKVAWDSCAHEGGVALQSSGEDITGTAGDDVITGTSGDDVLQGQDGDDFLYGAEGHDYLSGGAGADQFMFDAVNQGIDVIRDFSSGEGDVLDLSGLINSYDPTQQAIDNFIFARDVDGGTILSVDVSGSGDMSNAVDLVALEGMQNLDVQALVEAGNIHVV